MKKIIIILALLFVGLTIQAQTTYYIDPAGSDADGNGTIGNPWKSLYKACNSVTTSGDLIHVNAGTFTETTESSLRVGVSIEGEGVKSILHSNITSAYGSLIRLSSGSENTNGNQHISNVKFQSTVTDTSCAIWLIARGNVEINNCTFENFKDWGIRLRGGVSDDGEPTTYASNNKIYNCIFSNCASYQLHIGGSANISINGQEGLLIHDCTITQTARTAGVENGVGIKAVPGFTKGLKIYNNTITCDPYSDSGNYEGNCWAFTIELWDGQGTEIYNNNLYNGAVDIGGYYEKKGTYDYSVSLHDNFIGRTALTDLGSIGIIIEASKELSDVLIYNNLIKNVNTGIYWTPTNNVSYQNIQIYYNIFDQIGMDKNGNTANTWAIQAYSDSGTGYICSNWKIQNNVFIASSRVGGYQYSAIILPNKSDATVDHIYIQNNIIQGWDFTPIYIRNDEGGAIDYLWIQNNLYYGNGNSNAPRINITPTNTTYSGDIVTNPVFVSTSDFHFQTGSPAIGKGIHIASLLMDYDGNPVGNPPEIGAYEFISSDNHPPSIQDQGFQLNENSPNGTAVGTVVASDPDAGQTLAYSIVSGNTNGVFAINALTGVLSVANVAALNVDFSLVVKVQDNGAGELSSQATITINILPAIATTYYISPNGSNTANGSITTPWKTLAYACARVTTPGDTIFVTAGTYTETAQSKLAVGVSIVGAGNTSIINSTYTNGSALQSTIQLASAAGTTTDGNQSISYIKMTGSSYTGQRAIAVNYRNNVTIHHCTIEQFAYSGIFFYSSGTYPDLFMTGNKVHDCIINDCAGGTTGHDGLIRTNGNDGLEVYNCVLRNTNKTQGTNLHSLSLSRNRRTKIHDNTLYKNDSEIDSEGVYHWNFFLEEWDYKGGSEYYNNTHYGLAKFSLGGEFNDMTDGTTFGYKVYNNKFYNEANGNRYVNGDEETLYCIVVEGDQHREVYVYNNFIQRYAVGIAVSTPSSGEGYWHHYWEWDGIYIYYNVIEKCGYADFQYGAHGIWWINETNVAPYYGTFENVNIYNNTITGTNEGAYEGYHGIAVYANGKVTGLNIINNNIYDVKWAGISINEHVDDGLTLTNLNVTYNNIYECGNSNDPYLEAAGGARVYTNVDIATGNIKQDPLFVSASNFHLQAGSPCINAGTNVGLTTPFITTDYDSVTIGNPPTIGAYEFIIGDNHLPSIKDQGFQLNDNSPNGTAAGTIFANDTDAGQTLTYSIVSGNTNGAFAINALTGLLSVANSAELTVDFPLVVKVQDNGVGELSNQATITIHIINTGIELTGDDEAIKVYPNPVSDELTIEIGGNKERLSFSILNSIGQIVFEGNLLDKTVVQTTSFSPGVYLMKIEDGRTFKFKKIVKV